METTSRGQPSSIGTDRVDVVVVGGGQAGLAMGYFLARQERRFVILEAAAEPAAAWRERWDSLKLFTPVRYDSLPDRSFPGEPDSYPGRDEVVAYLADYARHFDLPVEMDSRVRSLRRVDGIYLVELDDRRYEAEQVVVATGPFQVPFLPSAAERLSPNVVQMHSSAYRSPPDARSGPVLVVGGGNTGFQIAAELSGSHEVHLSVGSRQIPLPQRFLGRDLFAYLQATGLMKKTRASRLGRRMKDRETLIGSAPRTLRRRHGVTLRPRTTGASGTKAFFADGTQLTAGTVIWATGFRPDHSWIELPVFDESGNVAHERGVTAAPGLSFLGLPWQHTRGSALLGWVKDDAEHLAKRIAAFRREPSWPRPRRDDLRDRDSEEHQMSPETDRFPTDTAGLPESGRPELVELADGDAFDLRVTPVAKRIGEGKVRMLGYNGSIPGPTLKVQEGSEIVVNIVNDGDMDATVHWHGLRLDNRYDGTHETQEPIAVGSSFAARVTFPDPGLYWYHPHIREDYGQEMGLYGNVLVVPRDPEYWPPAHREVLLTLDDILLEDGKVAPFSRSETTHSAMGRFGDVLLVAGEPDLRLAAQRGEVVRFYLTNTANTRVFKVALSGAQMKLVGGDSGRAEREELVDELVIAPSERLVVDALFDRPGELRLEHRTPDRVYPLAAIVVSEEGAEPSLAEEFHLLRSNPDMVAERERIAPHLDAPPEKTLAFIAEMDMDAPEGDGPLVYTCPMHPEVVSDEPGHCPECGMKLLAIEAPATTYTCPMHPEVVSEDPGHCPECGMKLLPSRLVAEAGGAHEHDHASAEGVEWEDDMVDVNRLTTPANMRWKLIDRDTGAENAAIDWRFEVGDQIKIRLLNEMAGDHPMHHPFHVHGAGRFLVLSRDGVVETNLMWHDTVLVRTGETVDILLDVTNPGVWMSHCHIAEHHESGMMFSFEVTPRSEPAP